MDARDEELKGDTLSITRKPVSTEFRVWGGNVSTKIEQMVRGYLLRIWLVATIALGFLVLAASHVSD